MRISLLKTVYKDHCAQENRLTQWHFIGRGFLENTVLKERDPTVLGGRKEDRWLQCSMMSMRKSELMGYKTAYTGDSFTS